MDKFKEHQRKAGIASNRNLTDAQRQARRENMAKARAAKELKKSQVVEK